jgi:hypothetical protein
VVGDDNAIEAVAMEDREDAEYVHIAIVDEGLAVVGDFAADVSKVNVGDTALPAVGVDGVIDVVLGHLGERSDAEFKSIAGAWIQVDEALVHARLVDEAGLVADEGKRRVVGVGGEADAGAFGDGKHLVQEAAKAVPKLVVRGRGN